MKHDPPVLSRHFTLRIVAILLCTLGWSYQVVAQNCNTNFRLFGLAQTGIYSRNKPVFFGVLKSETGYNYSFTQENLNSLERKSKGGPLDGTGQTLSVAAFMQSASDAGEYKVAENGDFFCESADSFYAFYGNIDNLRINAWGQNKVSFKWRASGPFGAVFYQYAITREANPDAGTFDLYSTSDTSYVPDAGADTLVSGMTYYIHVRVDYVEYAGDTYFAVSGSSTPWQTLRFVSCSANPGIGSLSPLNVIICTGSTATLTASGGSGYQWYKDDVLIPGQTAASLTASAAGEYKLYMVAASGCRGQVSSAMITDTTLTPGVLSGSGAYCMGDSVSLAISNTQPGQIYKIRKDGVEVGSVTGVGTPYENTNTVWFKFLIDSPSDFGTYTVRTSNGFCTSIDFGNANVFSVSNPLVGLSVQSVTEFSAQLSWTAPGPGVVAYEYAVTTTTTTPISGNTWTNNNYFLSGLLPSTTYYFHVRPKCGQGISPGWASVSFTTQASSPNCNSIINFQPDLNLCTSTPLTVTIPAGTGTWNFDGKYPINSAGIPTPGKEQIIRFTPIATGVYYLNVLSAQGTLSYLYKRESSGCNSYGWTGIGAILSPGKYPIGMLEQGVSYYIVLDNNITTAKTHQFTICRAWGASLPTSNCYYYTFPYTIPAGSPKEEFVLSDNGDIIASLDFNRVSTDQTGVQFGYRDLALPVGRFENTEYLRRTYTIDRTTGAADPLRVKLYFRNADLQSLINEPNDGIADVASISDLKVGFNQVFNCASTSFDTDIFSLLSAAEYDSQVSYVMFDAIGFPDMSFYIRGGTVPMSYKISLPHLEDFATNQNPKGWKQQYVQGASNITFQTSVLNPTTTAFSGSKFVSWNSYSYLAGTRTRLISAPININGTPPFNMNVDFYWFNNNNPSYSTGSYLNEGVQVEYSYDNVNWVAAGAFFPRHDGTLTAGTGQWKKKTVALPTLSGHPTVYIAFRFQSEYGDNCAMDAVSFYIRPACASVVSNINVTNVGSHDVSFNWPAVAGALRYDFMVEKNPGVPVGYDLTTATSASMSDLIPSTDYYIKVRAVCASNQTGAWTIQKTSTLVSEPCDFYPLASVGESSSTTAYIPAGNGIWDFSGIYPINSDGYATPGKEKAYEFVPEESGVYYLEVLSGDGWVDYFYKPADANGCYNNSDWIGIDDIFSSGKRAIGFLEANRPYYILLDKESTLPVTHVFRIKKATIGIIPPGSCVDLSLSSPLPANSPKEEFLIDVDGNVYAGLDFRNASSPPGYVTASVYDNNGPIRRDVGGREYLDRSITVNTDNGSTNPVNFRFFFPNSYLQRLINEPNDGIADVAAISELGATRVQYVCGPGVYTGGTSFSPQTAYSDDSNMPFVIFNTPALEASFYLHGAGPLETLTDELCPGTGSTTIAMPQPGVGYSYQWQVNTGSGYVNITNGGFYANATTSTLTILNPPTSFNGYKYRCLATKGNSIVSNPEKTIKFTATWLGNSSEWEDEYNWSCGTIPDQYTTVLIPPAVNSPVINSNAACKELNIQQGSILTVNPGFKLTVTGTSQ